MRLTPLGRRQAGPTFGEPDPEQLALEQAFQMRTRPGTGPSSMGGLTGNDMPVSAFGGGTLGGPTTAPDMTITPQPGGWVPPGPSPTGPYAPAGSLLGSPTGGVQDIIDRSRGNTGVNGGDTPTYTPGDWGTMRVPYQGDTEAPGGGPGEGPEQPDLPPGPNVPPSAAPPVTDTALTTTPAPTTGAATTGPTTQTGPPSDLPQRGNVGQLTGYPETLGRSMKHVFGAIASRYPNDRNQLARIAADPEFQRWFPNARVTGDDTIDFGGQLSDFDTGVPVYEVDVSRGGDDMWQWIDQAYVTDDSGGGGSAGQGAGSGGAIGGPTAGGVGGVDYSMLPSGSNNILQAILGQGVGGGGDQSVMAQIMAELQALMRGGNSTLNQPALEQAFNQQQPKSGRL